MLLWNHYWNIIYQSLERVKQVTDVRGDLSHIGFDLDELQRMVSGLVGEFVNIVLFV